MSSNDEAIFRTRAEILTNSLKERDEQLEKCGQTIFELRAKINELEKFSETANYILNKVSEVSLWADEIEVDNEMLRNEVKSLRKERDAALKKIDELQDVCGDSADRMVELRKERDEARMEVCKHEADRWESAQQYAESRDWDCFRD